MLYYYNYYNNLCFIYNMDLFFLNMYCMILITHFDIYVICSYDMHMYHFHLVTNFIFVNNLFKKNEKLRKINCQENIPFYEKC